MLLSRPGSKITMAHPREMPGQKLRITAAVCIDAWDEHSLNAICSLRQQSLSRDFFEILIVGDAELSSHLERLSADGEFYPGLRHVTTASTHKTELRALAAAEARAPIVAFLDRQASAKPNWLASFCRTFDRFGERAIVVGGRVLPVWEVPRPDWLSDQLLPELSLVDLGDEVRFVEAAERIAAVNIAFRTSNAGALNRFTQARAFSTGLLTDTFTCDAGYGADPDIYDPLATVEYRITSKSLDQRQFRTRAARRAIAGILRSKPAPAETVDEAWRAAKAFFMACPPSDRTVRALVLSQNDPNGFASQLRAIHDVFLSLLSGISEADDE